MILLMMNPVCRSVPLSAHGSAVMRPSLKGVAVLLLALEALLSCSDLGSAPVLEVLECEYLSGGIGADMMPVIPPSPNERVGCVVEVRVRNRSGNELRPLLRILRAELYGGGTRTHLGTVHFSAAWDGHLAAWEVDTVRLIKQGLSADFVQPACGSGVTLDIEVGESENNLIHIMSDSLTFGCVY